LSHALILAFCLFPFVLAEKLSSAQNSGASNTDEAQIRALVHELFAADAREDMEGFMRLWSQKSPDTPIWRANSERNFEEREKTEFSNIEISNIEINGEQARAQVKYNFSYVEAKTGKLQTTNPQRIFRFVKEGGAWKMWRNRVLEEDLAFSLADLKTNAERQALLEKYPELQTPRLWRALNLAGERMLRDEELDRALDFYEFMLRFSERINYRAGVADSTTRKGTVYNRKGEYEKALEQCQRSLQMSEKENEKRSAGRALQCLGNTYNFQGNYVQALDSYQAALKIGEEVQDTTIATLINMGAMYGYLGDSGQAIRLIQEAIALREKQGSFKSRQAGAYGNLGNIYKDQGDYSNAMQAYQKALKLSTEDRGDKRTFALATLGIGLVYENQGNYTQALDYYQKGLALYEALNDKPNMTVALNNIGLIYFQLGNYEQALSFYEKSLKLAETIKVNPRIAQALLNLGVLHKTRHDYARALQLMQQSLALHEQAKYRVEIANVLREMADVYYLQGDFKRAQEFAMRAADTARGLGNEDYLWQSLLILGRAQKGLKEYERARQSFTEAIAAVEALRAHAVGGESDRQLFFEKQVAPYQEMVKLLVAQGKTDEAFVYAERAKARTLLDVLQNGRPDLSRAMTAQERERERRLKSELISLNTELMRELENERPESAKRINDLRTRLQKARLDLEGFQTALYAAHPQLRAQRGEAQTMTLAQVAEQLPDRESALLEYLVTDEKTYLFVLTKGTRVPLETKVYTLAVTAKDLTAQAERFRQLISTREPFQQLARQLYDSILRPAEAQLRGRTNLVIAPDGPLWNLPFQALQNGPERFLLEDAAVSYAPSLTALREMQRARQKRLKSGTQEGSTLLAIGNPTVNAQTVERAELVLRSGGKLESLVEAEREVAALGELYGARMSRVYTGAQASEEAVKAEAEKYRVLQLATHGVLNDVSPMYSYLVFSQAGVKNTEDGLLEAWEMMNLNLNADLVVLSACETARGRISSGEGVIGMSWALFVAGSPTTVVSQWKVSSDSTAELMLDFHRNLKGRSAEAKQPMTKAHAMRQAALKLMKKGGAYRHPFYWAAFVVVGDGG
jgi:CHAT domain-containing protein